MEIRILFSLKPLNIKFSSLYAQRWLFIDINLLIVMPSWLYSIIILVVCEFADDCLTCMLHRNVAGCWRAWKNQSQEGSGGHEALCICGSWCFRHGWHMWAWSDFMLSKIRHENKFPKFENDGKFFKRFVCLTSCRFPFPTSSFWHWMYDADGPAEEIYGKLLREYLGPRPVRGFTKFVPRYGKQCI